MLKPTTLQERGGRDAPASVEITHGELEAVQEALLLGLAALGELTRLENAFQCAQIIRPDLPPELSPAGVADVDALPNFATALHATASLIGDSWRGIKRWRT